MLIIVLARTVNIVMRIHERVAIRWLFPLMGMLVVLPLVAQEKESHLPYPVDLAKAAREAGAEKKAFLFLFSVDGCSYCEVVRQHHLRPLTGSSSSPMILEVKIGDGRSFINFDGKTITHAYFARRYNARWAPTVIILDYKGTQLTAPLVGGDTSGLYGGMLEKAIHEANVQISRLR